MFLLIYLPAIQLEEQHLQKLFPSFAPYSKRVRSLLPALKPAPAEGRFRFSLYIRNREYQASLGFLVGAMFLVARAIVLHIH